MPLKANKVTHVPKLISTTRSKAPRWILVHKGPKHPRFSFVIPHCKLRVFHWADAPSETLNEWFPHHPHPLLTSQHRHADVSFFDLRFYIPEITGVRSSKLPPLRKSGDNCLKGAIICQSKTHFASLCEFSFPQILMLADSAHCFP